MAISITGAHNYKVKEEAIVLPALPRDFHGIRIAQISDIHAGSFYNKRSVKKGVDLLLSLRPDIIFFTGDLVNKVTHEIRDFFEIFAKVQAPLGVYSVLGNHDYGDYLKWPSNEAKVRNMLDMVKAHEALGWELLLNDHRILGKKGEELAIIGVENWGKGRFSKYGDIARAYEGTEEAPVKLLLSHDPSYWNAVVTQDFQDIDITFSGHTHGFQFGVELGNFQWSPSKYKYKQWAGLYEREGQYLYVNRGFGFLNVPLRVGIMPEITLIELRQRI